MKLLLKAIIGVALIGCKYPQSGPSVPTKDEKSKPPSAANIQKVPYYQGEQNTPQLEFEEISIYSSPMPGKEGWMTHRYEFDVPNTNWQYVLICETEDLTGEGSTHSYGNMTSINLYRPQGLKPLLLPVVHKKAGLQSFVTWLPWAGHYAIAVAWNGPFVVGLYRSKHKLKDEELPWGILTKDFSRKWLAALADFEKILEEREVKRRDDELWEDYQARRRASERLRRGR